MPTKPSVSRNQSRVVMDKGDELVPPLGVDELIVNEKLSILLLWLESPG